MPASSPALILLAAAAQAPSAEAQSAGSAIRAADLRVASVVHRLATRGIAHCQASLPVTGLLLHHLDEYAEADKAEVIRRYGIDRAAGVLAVVPGSSASKAGVMAGDLLVSVNGVPLPRPGDLPKSTKPRQLADAADAILEEQARLGPASLAILREGKPLDLQLRPVMGCLARGRLARSNQANAFADGRYAIMTTKMLDFVRSDDELAVVMAHELAHNILRHPALLDEKKVPQGILRSFGKNAARVRETENEADRLAVKLLWSAGYDLSAAIPFWRRLYARFDPIPVPKLFRTHPSLGARERIVQEAIAELSAGAPGGR